MKDVDRIIFVYDSYAFYSIALKAAGKIKRKLNIVFEIWNFCEVFIQLYYSCGVAILSMFFFIDIIFLRFNIPYDLYFFLLKYAFFYLKYFT